jgi:CHAT domain-containing protein
MAPMPRTPGSVRVATFANSLGDLPLSGLECTCLEAELRLRGDDVTVTALKNLGEFGLVHLGVHVQRERGVPELVLADGVMSAAAIADLRLLGDPVVLLAGCGSADQARGEGVERSLSDAFLRAGASAVVATRWSLTDREAHDVFQPLLALWPFANAERAVARIATALRRAGQPPRVWASLAVYRA